MTGKRGAVEPAVIYTGVVAVLLIIIVALSFALIGRRHETVSRPAVSASAGTEDNSGDADASAASTQLPGSDSNDTVEAIHGRGGRSSESLGLPIPGSDGIPGGPGVVGSLQGRRAAPFVSGAPEFQAYLNWLGRMDGERHQLAGRGYATVRMLTSQSAGVQTPEGQRAVMEANRACQDFNSRLRISKPSVPFDCRDLDQNYVQGSEGELRVVMSMIAGAANGRAGKAYGAAAATRFLGNADEALVTACQNHGMQPPIRIRPE